MGDPSPSSMSALESEQQHLDLLYRLLDKERTRVRALKDAALFENDGTPSGLFTRDALQFRYAEQLAAYAAAEDKLCFGRLDMAGGTANQAAGTSVANLGDINGTGYNSFLIGAPNGSTPAVYLVFGSQNQAREAEDNEDPSALPEQ